MRIHEIILESVQSQEEIKKTINILKVAYNAERELLKFIDDHNKSVTNEGFADKIKKAAFAGALGLAALSPAAQGQTALHDLYNKPYSSPFVSKDTVTVIAACAADLQTMSNHARRHNLTKEASFFGRKSGDIMQTMRDHAKELGKPEIITKMDDVFKAQREKNSYLNQLSWKHLWPDKLKDQVEANMTECLTQIAKLEQNIATSKASKGK
jgi:ferritin-like metal-binding protein YciE